MNDEQEVMTVCDCYPEHCTHGDSCWCEPTVLPQEGGESIIIHREIH